MGKNAVAIFAALHKLNVVVANQRKSKRDGPIKNSSALNTPNCIMQMCIFIDYFPKMFDCFRANICTM